MSPKDETINSSDAAPYVLPKYVRFARSLALVSGAAIGIAAGATVVGAGGCSFGCSGICGVVPGVRAPLDAQYDTPQSNDGGRPDAATDGSAGGGPLPAPLFPQAWLA